MVRPSVILALLIVAQSAVAETGSLKITLSPNLEAVSESLPISPLHEVVAEARLPGEGIALSPRTDPYQWTRISSANDPFLLDISLERDAFDYAILTAWNWHNEPVFQKEISTTGRTPCEISVEGLGTYLLTLDGFGDGVFQKRFIRNVAVTEDVKFAQTEWKTDEFFVGVCAFPGRYHWQSSGEPNLPAGMTESS